MAAALNRAGEQGILRYGALALLRRRAGEAALLACIVSLILVLLIGDSALADSRYTVEETDLKGTSVVVLTDSETGQTAMVLPSVGNNCISYKATIGGREVELLYAAPDAETLQGRPSGYGIPILFPWPNRIEYGKFTFEGKNVQLATPSEGAHLLHGYVLNRPWQMDGSGSSEEDGAWVTCRFKSGDFEEIGAEWPFPFEVEGTYRLKDGALSVEVKGTNVGDGNMPAGLGYHPYFPLPLLPSGDRKSCTVQLPCETYWPLRDDNVPTGETKPVADEYALQEKTALGERYYDDVWSGVSFDSDGWSRCHFEDPDAGIQIVVEADSSFREWVLFAPDSRPVVCFEPYTCTTDAVNLQGHGVDAGLSVLEPGGFLTGTMRFVPTASK
jgi:aldose 1-epimerase